MKTIDIILRVAGIAVFLSFFAFPDHGAPALALCGLLFAVGLWAVLYPPGILGWVRPAGRLDPTDERLWPYCKFIGGAIVALSVVVAATMLRAVQRG